MLYIPENIDGVRALMTARGWERAAIVWAYVNVEEHGGDRVSKTKKRLAHDKHSTESFAALDIAGLRSKDTVRAYWQRWQDAIDSGNAVPVVPGDQFTPPELPWAQEPDSGGKGKRRSRPSLDSKDSAIDAFQREALRTRRQTAQELEFTAGIHTMDDLVTFTEAEAREVVEAKNSLIAQAQDTVRETQNRVHPTVESSVDLDDDEVGEKPTLTVIDAPEADEAAETPVPAVDAPQHREERNKKLAQQIDDFYGHMGHHNPQPTYDQKYPCERCGTLTDVLNADLDGIRSCESCTSGEYWRRSAGDVLDVVEELVLIQDHINELHRDLEKALYRDPDVTEYQRRAIENIRKLLIEWKRALAQHDTARDAAEN